MGSLVARGIRWLKRRFFLYDVVLLEPGTYLMIVNAHSVSSEVLGKLRVTLEKKGVDLTCLRVFGGPENVRVVRFERAMWHRGKLFSWNACLRCRGLLIGKTPPILEVIEDAAKKMMPQVVDAFFRPSPVLAYLKRQR